MDGCIRTTARAKAARGYPCTHVRTPEPPEARPKKTIPTDKERKAPKTRRYQSAHTWQPELARWQSIIPRTQKPTQARAWWQSIPSAAISGFPLPPTDPRESCGMPVAGRRSAGTSAGVHPSKTSHASAATCNHCAKRAQREARRRGPALQQAPDAELSLLSKETERSGHLPHGGVDGNMPAQPAPKRRAVGSSKEKNQAKMNNPRKSMRAEKACTRAAARRRQLARSGSEGPRSVCMAKRRPRGVAMSNTSTLP